MSSSLDNVPLIYILRTHTTTSLVLAMRYVSWQELGIQFDLGAPEATGVLQATLPSAFFASGAQVLGQQVLMTEVVSGEPVSLLSYAATNLSSLMLGLLRVWITARLFTRENVVFGR